jgi:hypothetical protein
MARLGEHLIAANVVGADKVDQALRAQVVWGGRLGTTLIELGCIELDELSRMLGQQHAIPAALGRHFDRADPALQALLPVAIAKQYSVVPLVRLAEDRIAVVALDPLGPAALRALGEVYGVDPQIGIVMSVAAEMRVLYHLERVYKIPRATRYLRSKNAGRTMEFPAFDNVPIEIDLDSELAAPIMIDESAHPTGRAERRERGSIPPGLGSADDIAAMIDQAIDTLTAHPPSADEPTGRERRTYVRTLAEVDTLAAPKAETLGRIALHRVAITPERGVAVVAAIAAADTVAVRPPEPTTLPDAARAIKRGPNRDRVAELIVETLEQFVPACHAALLLVIRGDIAIGWKHFSRDGEGTHEIAVPLDEPGLVPAAIAANQTARSVAADLAPIDHRLLYALGALDADDGDLVVVPIAIGSKVMCLLATATERAAPPSPLESIASAAGAAFARLIRDASR